MISSAKKLRKKRCKSDNYDVLVKQRYNQMYSNIKKGKAKEYFNKIFYRFIINQIPKLVKFFKLYIFTSTIENLINKCYLRNSFRDFITNILYEENNKYSSMLNKIENEEEKEKDILPSIKNIAASVIQFYYRKYSQKIHQIFRIEMLMKILENLEDEKILLLLYYRKWKYRINKERNEKEICKSYLRDLFIKYRNQNLVNKINEFTDKYSDYIHIVTFGDIFKKIFSMRLFNSLKLRFILCKFICDDDAEFKKKYIRSKMMKKWNEKCKLLRRRKMCLMKVRKILKLHSKKLLLNLFKLKKFKLYFLAYALLRRDKNRK
jgi:superfamily II DNA helicase RecQ